VVGWVQMRSYNPNFTKVFDGVSCKMMAVFPCRSGASQNPLNLRASRFENTCEKEFNHGGFKRCFCTSQGLGGLRGVTLDAGARLGSSLDLRSSTLSPMWREANPALFAPSRTGSSGHPPLPAHPPDPKCPPFRPPGTRLLPVRLLPLWPPVCRPVQGPFHRRVPIRGAPVVALLIRRSSKPSSRPA